MFRLFMNLIAKAVTSPFALLSSAFGGGEELAYAEFTPGLATLTPATQTRLDTLTKALKDRPALRLDITGWVDPQADLEGIREAILSRKIRAMKRKDASNQNDDAESDDLNVPEADKAHYLERIYKDEKVRQTAQPHRLREILATERNGKKIDPHQHEGHAGTNARPGEPARRQCARLPGTER
ncbi:hypothetical protein ACFS07_27105 [Undibacterium arcticum]